MGRLFTFGCSFTQYMWPTWANVVAYDLKLPLYNFAVAGLGNVGIMNRVMEADMKFKFTPEDKIMIMWSSWSRDDYVTAHGHWHMAGSRFNQRMSSKQISKLKSRWSPFDDIVKNANAVAYVTKAYEKNITWQGYGFEPWVQEGDTETLAELFLDNESLSKYLELIEFYKTKIPSLPYRQLEMTSTPAFGHITDSHPDVAEHVNIVQNFIYPSIDCCIEQETVGIFSALHNTIKKTCKRKNIRALNELQHVPMGIIIEHYPEIHPYMNIRSLTDDILG